MKRIKRSVIKEAFDNLPGAVCFFDRNGMVTLCNYQMYRLVFSLTGRDLQSLAEMQGILRGDFLMETVSGLGSDMFLLEDGSVWRFLEETVTTQDGNTYIQVTAADVTELYSRQKELEQDNRKLEEYAKRMRRLSASIIAVIREEEILSMKMRVHDDIGRSVIATRQFLQQKKSTKDMDLTEWKNAISLLKHDNEIPEKENELERLMTAAESIGIRILPQGDLPSDTAVSEVLIAAVRECMTNAVRHAGASRLYVKLTCDNCAASAVITNDGAAPRKTISEGGGLSSLRARIGQKGGTMEVRSIPEFELRVTVPLRMEETL